MHEDVGLFMVQNMLGFTVPRRAFLLTDGVLTPFCGCVYSKQAATVPDSPSLHHIPLEGLLPHFQRLLKGKKVILFNPTL